MKPTGCFPLTASVNPEHRFIVGQVVPFGEEGQPGLNGGGVRLVIQAGGLTWDTPKQSASARLTIPSRSAAPSPCDESAAGIVASFTVANTQAGTDALTLAAEGLQAGLSMKLKPPTPSPPPTTVSTRSPPTTPARLTAVALVESPRAFIRKGHSRGRTRKETQ